ncbi:conserved hypothetical protein [Vibrio coralliirubri]|uniref:hypothetical protein n=1 Tax=Vibrio coralliirubri TaxID=1516159 RepID=UPI00063421F2|nr:hypothetical protein [Vibrio coralliirubri]CDT98731.1 conserved hypothetical protein [Vibrio coralliirubri]
MSLENIRLVDSVCKRIPYKVLQLTLKELSIKTKSGIAQIEAKLKEKAESTDEADLAHLELLKSFYLSYLVSGDKTVSISSIDEGSLLKVLSDYSSILCPVSPEVINYPYYDEATDKHLNEVPQLVNINPVDDGLLFTFASLKTLIETVELDEDYFKQIGAGEEFKLPKELYDAKAKKLVQRRYYDTVLIRQSDSTVEFRLDTASISSKTVLLDALDLLRKTFAKTIAPLNQEEEVVLQTQNLFRAIPGAYQFSELRVCELGFSVGNVTHHEKMRVSKRDLRDEQFHKGGKSSIEKAKTDLSVFRIAVRKQKVLEGIGQYETETYLPGIAKMIHSMTVPYLEYAIISNCTTNEDYNSHISEIKSDMDKYSKYVLTE